MTCQRDNCDNDADVLLSMNILDEPIEACEACAKDELFADPENTTIAAYEVD